MANDKPSTRFADVLTEVLKSVRLSATKFAALLEAYRAAHKGNRAYGISKTAVLSYLNGRRLPSNDTFQFIFDALSQNVLITEQQLDELRSAFRASISTVRPSDECAAGNRSSNGDCMLARLASVATALAIGFVAGCIHSSLKRKKLR